MQIKRFNTFKETELHLKSLIEIPGGSMNSKVSKVSLVNRTFQDSPKKEFPKSPPKNYLNFQ